MPGNVDGAVLGRTSARGIKTGRKYETKGMDAAIRKP